MSRREPVFDADTRGWGFAEWAHEAAISRAVQEDILRRQHERKQKASLLGRFATSLSKYVELRSTQEGDDDE